VDLSAERFRPGELTFIQQPTPKAMNTEMAQPSERPDVGAPTRKKID